MEEASHKELDSVYFHLHELSRTGKSMETESKLVVAYGVGGREVV